MDSFVLLRICWIRFSITWLLSIVIVEQSTYIFNEIEKCFALVEWFYWINIRTCCLTNRWTFMHWGLHKYPLKHSVFDWKFQILKHQWTFPESLQHIQQAHSGHESSTPFVLEFHLKASNTKLQRFYFQYPNLYYQLLHLHHGSSLLYIFEDIHLWLFHKSSQAALFPFLSLVYCKSLVDLYQLDYYSG